MYKKSVISTLLAILLFTIGYSQNKKNINLNVFNCLDNTNVSLYSYSNLENNGLIFKTLLKNQKCSFQIPEKFTDGIYNLRINFPNTNSKLNNVMSFDIIIDQSENDITIDYYYDKKDFPNFKYSEINKNWYSYLMQQDKILKELKMISNNSFVSNNKLPNENIYTIKDKLSKLKLNFLSQNFNFWSANSVKYSRFEFSSSEEMFTEDNFWNDVDTSNSKLINSPIYQNIIQKHTFIFSLKDKSILNYKLNFDILIKRFSENDLIKHWVIDYLKQGVYQLGNKELKDYFLTTYK